VCLQREILEQNVLEMKQYIAAKVDELETLIQEMGAMQRHLKDIDGNKNFIIEVNIHVRLEIFFRPLQVTRSVERQTKIPGNFFDTRCRTCDFLCHRNCDMATEGDKENCWAMNYWGDCKMCPGKCSFTHHINVDHRVEFEKVKQVSAHSATGLIRLKRQLQKETDEDMKKRYGQSVDEKLRTERVLEKIAEQMMTTEVVEQFTPFIANFLSLDGHSSQDRQHSRLSQAPR
jgi:hypothetical protein